MRQKSLRTSDLDLTRNYVLVVAKATCLTVSDRSPRNSSWQRAKCMPLLSPSFEHHTGDSAIWLSSIPILKNGMSLLACLIDLSGLLQIESRTRATVSSITKTYGYLPVSDTKVPVSFKALSHWWMDFGVGGSTFHSVRTRCCTPVAHTGIFQWGRGGGSPFLYHAPFDFVDFREQSS
ncbi:uncharacterized protein TNCV_4408271 [Trichonephila clavipes]|nr:uncharacterized protein TNCV_4408271 [Trichonephila clavipes]